MEFHRDPGIVSWGRIGKRAHEVARPRFAEDVRAWNTQGSVTRLAVGSRRSYSDVCLSDGGRLVDMTGLDRFRTFDPTSGILTVREAGVTIDALLKAFVPLGFFCALGDVLGIRFPSRSAVRSRTMFTARTITASGPSASM